MRDNVIAMGFTGLRIKQKRSKLTYNALITTGFKLLEQRELEAISIAELAKTAGYSVGAFYSRFRSKDEFFEAMIEHHLKLRSESQATLYNAVTQENLVPTMVNDVVGYYWSHRRFWRAALVRSMRDPDFWEPIRQRGREFASVFIDQVVSFTNRPLTELEESNIYFAFQITFGTVNNTIINRPGPIFMGQTLFVENLTKAFRLVSDYDRLISSSYQSEA